MAYILGKQVFLDRFKGDSDLIEFDARASVTEINSFLEVFYGEPKLVEWMENFSEYEYDDIRVKYIVGSKLNVRIFPKKNGGLGKLEELVRKL